jgi:hypothetical protein
MRVNEVVAVAVVQREGREGLFRRGFRQQGRDVAECDEPIAVFLQPHEHDVQKGRSDFQVSVGRKGCGFLGANMVKRENRAASASTTHEARRAQQIGSLESACNGDSLRKHSGARRHFRPICRFR